VLARPEFIRDADQVERLLCTSSWTATSGWAASAMAWRTGRSRSRTQVRDYGAAEVVVGVLAQETSWH
jgi:hypothetical protein